MQINFLLIEPKRVPGTSDVSLTDNRLMSYSAGHDVPPHPLRGDRLYLPHTDQLPPDLRAQVGRCGGVSSFRCDRLQPAISHDTLHPLHGRAQEIVDRILNTKLLLGVGALSKVSHSGRFTFLCYVTGVEFC